MIENISINNYALIDLTHIEVEKGFSVITGETGAGKSILLGAIGLTLGRGPIRRLSWIKPKSVL